jgi:hypothetical protein
MISIFADLPQRQAVTLLRILYPVWAIIGLFSIQYVPATLIVAGDAAETAKNILDNELLFRTGIAGSLVTQLIHIVVVLILYKLFETVSKNQATVLVILGLVGVPIAMLNELSKFAALFLLKGTDFLKVFEVDQLHALAMTFLNMNDQGIIIAGIFWGLWLLPLGYLVYKSGYFPKLIGYLVIIAGIAYTLDSFVRILSPEAFFLPLFQILILGEVAFMLWVVFKGAKIPAVKASKR